MSPTDLHFVVPGPLRQLTGGYIYDVRMVEGLTRLGWRIRVHELPGRFPDADNVAEQALREALQAIPGGSRVVIDALAMGGQPAVLEAHGDRLRIISMLHHPLAEETGISAEEARRLAVSERRALVPCAGTIVSSTFTARALSDYDVSADRIRVVVPGTERVPLSEGPLPGEPATLLCVASITPRKGHDVLVAALDRVRDLSWRCVCAGSLQRDPDHARRVTASLQEADLEDRVDFVGERQGADLRRLYLEASAFVLASFYEGYGMALAEALAHGLPVVSTSGGAIPYTVPPDAGILVEPGDAEAFAAALRRLLDPEGGARSELSAAARRHAATLPTWEQSASEFASAVEALTG